MCYDRPMAKQSFSEIRAQFPSAYLLLFDYDEIRLSDREVEIVSADDVQHFESGEEMLAAFRTQRGSGRKVMFCTPDYQDRLVIERRPGLRVFG